MIDSRGFFITKKNVDEVRQEIMNVVKMPVRGGNGVFEEKTYYKRYCEMTLRMLNDCFESGMFAIENYKNEVKKYKDSDDVNRLRKGKQVSDEILLDLGAQLCSVIPLKDLPTCKPILDCSKDVAMECAKDMANEKYVRMGLGLVSMLSKVNDKVTIESVWHFYNNIIIELEREAGSEGWTFCPIEQALFDKAKAERAYCYKAMLKTGICFVHELIGIIDEATADNDIKRFEESNAVVNNSNVVIGKQ